MKTILPLNARMASTLPAREAILRATGKAHGAPARAQNE